MRIGEDCPELTEHDEHRRGEKSESLLPCISRPSPLGPLWDAPVDPCDSCILGLSCGDSTCTLSRRRRPAGAAGDQWHGQQHTTGVQASESMANTAKIADQCSHSSSCPCRPYPTLSHYARRPGSARCAKYSMPIARCALSFPSISLDLCSVDFLSRFRKHCDQQRQASTDPTR